MRAGKSLSGLVLATVAVLALAAPAFAAGAVKTTITIDVGYSQPGERFTTTGGALCPSGDAVTDDSIKARFGGSAATFHGFKTLTCDDNSGSFTISFDAATRFGSGHDQGGWSVIDGTGDYAGLSGGGNLVGTYQVPEGIIDLYTGRVHL